ncbi:hypothetical protein [Pararhodobacter sp. CCB-MM2]|uniref:hypothetical protein n=1 Tax=Pararhodobacter sp. CCB-MM2 TaxID=1786003 RepID=UPI0008367F12|nr:hypothetical protein [Pararhodobacter sp. CCB-MM2]
MTALDKYARLEGSGVWRAGPDDQRRDVVVGLGESSLVISDAKSGQALSHWSLPAVQRRNRGTRPAVYTPSEGDDETLELEDALLIEALETIRNALSPKPPLPWLRLGLAGAALAAVLVGVLYLPAVLVARTAAIVPPAARDQIGRDALDELLESAAGERVCADPEGRQSLAILRNRILGGDWRIVVVAGVPGAQAAHLPGQVVVLGEALLARLDSPEALAGYIGAEALARQARDPLLDTLRYAGTGATVTLLTTGNLPEDALRGYARQRLAAAPALPDAAAMGAWFTERGLSPTPYALSLPSERHALAEALADSAGGTRSGDPLLSDGEWLTVQAICAR